MFPKIPGFLWSLATFVIVSAAVAAEPYLVKDISLGARPVSSSPQFAANVGTSTYFTVLEPSRNQRLWKTDGTEAGTVQVPTLGFFMGEGAPFGSLFLAVALDANFTRQLWKTDGTAAGTTMLTSGSDVHLGAIAADFSAAFFFALSSGGLEVWRSNGTPSGNVKLGTVPATFGIGIAAGIAATTSSVVFGTGTSIRAVDSSGGSSILAFGRVTNVSERVGSTTVFQVSTDPSKQLWKTDGTAAGTVLLRDHFVDRGVVSDFVRMGGFWYFIADDGATGLQLWRTDGTTGGTSLVAGTGAGGDGTTFRVLVASGPSIYFLATSSTQNGLWRSDGTAAGATLVKDGLAGAQLLSGSNGAVFFAWDDGVHGMEPWRSDGTPAGTVLLRDIIPGAASSMGSNTSSITRPDGLTLFAASNGVNGEEPWISDGTAAGTRLLKDAAADQANGSSPRAFANVGNRLMFIADDSEGSAVWSSDGTESGTQRAGPMKGEVGQAIASAGLYYFTRKLTTGGAELWRSDGSVAGTFALAQAVADVLLPMSGGVIFWGRDDLHGVEPWFSDGTLPGTRMIADINPGSASSYVTPNGALVSNGVFFFAAQGSNQRPAPWRSDGTTAGTRAITPDVLSPRAFTDVNGTIYFVGDLNDAAFDLWRTDGSNGSTVRIRHFEGIDRAPSLMWSVGGKLFFMLPHAGEFWRSDGTSAGTVMVSKVSVPLCANAQDYTVMNGVLYWIYVSDTSFELWRSDGTAAGTYQLPAAIDVNLTNETQCAPHPIIVASKRLFFAAPDSAHGLELWTSDGTSSGTRILTDLNPGTSSSSPAWLAVVGTTLFFDSYDGVHGRELWAYSLTEPPRRRAVKTGF